MVMPSHPRWSGRKIALLAAGAVALVALLAVFVMTQLDGLSGSELIVEKATDPRDSSAVVLDEARTRAEAPILAALLDRAEESGRTTTKNDRDALRSVEYLQRVSAEVGRPDGGDPIFIWRGGTFRIYRLVI